MDYQVAATEDSYAALGGMSPFPTPAVDESVDLGPV